jgi:peptidoglycan biosynthesis protein MviN/MurJ (putative lipid II flippase)
MSTTAYLLCLVGFAVIAFASGGLTKSSIIVVLAYAVASTVPWYFGTRKHSEGPSRTEQRLAGWWLWLRRILGTFGGVVSLAGAVHLSTVELHPHDAPYRWLFVLLVVVVGCAFFYFAVFGYSVQFNWRANIAFHVRNRKRYRWWF